MHARWAPYYIRNVRVAPLAALEGAARTPACRWIPENGQTTREPAHLGRLTSRSRRPRARSPATIARPCEQCEFWLQNKLHWTEHNPSVTITYDPDEVIDLMKWVWDHREKIGGMAFLPAFDAKYDQLPYIEIDKEEYERRVAEFPEIDFSKVYRYEARRPDQRRAGAGLLGWRLRDRAVAPSSVVLVSTQFGIVKARPPCYGGRVFFSDAISVPVSLMAQAPVIDFPGRREHGWTLPAR